MIKSFTSKALLISIGLFFVRDIYASTQRGSVECNNPNCSYQFGEKIVITVKDLPEPSSSDFELRVEGQIGGRVAKFKKVGPDYIGDLGLLHWDSGGQSLEINAYYIDPSEEKNVLSSIDKTSLDIRRVKALLKKSPSNELQNRLNRLVDYRNQWAHKIDSIKTIILKKVQELAAPPTDDGLPVVLNLGSNPISSSGSFYSTNLVPPIEVGSGNFSSRAEDVAIFLNSRSLGKNEFTIKSTRIEFTKQLKSKRNELRVVGHLENGKQFDQVFVIWAGHKDKQLVVKDINGAGLSNREVRALASGYEDIFQTRTSDASGNVYFNNLPEHAAITFVVNDAVDFGFQINNTKMSSQDIVVEDMSSIDSENLKLQYATYGWTDTHGSIARASSNSDLESFFKNPTEKTKDLRMNGLKEPHGSLPKMMDAVCDTGSCSLLLKTLGSNLSRTSHTFFANKNHYRLRFRFKTLEVWNGYHRTDYDDSFIVGYRNEAGFLKYKTGSMNSLGRGSFYENGISEWVDFDIETTVGQRVQVFAGVVNAGDDLYDSAVQLDFNSDSRLTSEVYMLGAVKAVGVGDSPYNNGFNRLNFNLVVNGEPGTLIDNASVYILADGVPVLGAIQSSTPTIANAVIDSSGRFTSDVEVDIKTTNLAIRSDAEVSFLFKLNESGTSLSAKALSSTPSLPAIVSLNTLEGRDPSFPIDTTTDGFDWLKPSFIDPVKQLIAHGFEYREASRANGLLNSEYLLNGNGSAINFAGSLISDLSVNNQNELVLRAYERRDLADKFCALLSDSHASAKIDSIYFDGRFWRSRGPQIDPFWDQMQRCGPKGKLVKPSIQNQNAVTVMFGNLE